MKRSYRNKKELIEDLIDKSESVLDVGFWGHGVKPESPHWVHRMLIARAAEVWGIDLAYDAGRLPQEQGRYHTMSAETFALPRKFDVIFAGDLIEHLPNPGLFIERARSHLNPGGRIILTTPNCFNLFSIAEKFSKGEPSVNPDHTCYFNERTLRQLLIKCGLADIEHSFMWWLDVEYEESWKKKLLNLLYHVLGRISPRFLETLVMVARADQSSART